MPSKNINGNNPLGGGRLDLTNGLRSTLEDLSREIGMRTPQQSMTSGKIQTLNGTIHAPKRRKSGGGGTTIEYPLEVLKSRPPYGKDPADEGGGELEDDEMHIWVRFGTINHILADNWRDFHVVTTGGDEGEPVINHVWAEVTLAQDDYLAVTSWKIMVGEELPEIVPDWDVEDVRPQTMNISLGSVVNGVIVTSHGNIVVQDVPTRIEFTEDGRLDVNRGVVSRRDN